MGGSFLTADIVIDNSLTQSLQSAKTSLTTTNPERTCTDRDLTWPCVRNSGPTSGLVISKSVALHFSNFCAVGYLLVLSKASAELSSPYLLVNKAVVAFGMPKNLCLTYRNDGSENVGAGAPSNKFRLHPDVRTRFARWASWYLRMGSDSHSIRNLDQEFSACGWWTIFDLQPVVSN